MFTEGYSLDLQADADVAFLQSYSLRMSNI